MDVILPKWKNGNGSQFMKNLDRHLRYEADLEQYEAKKREIICGQENQHGGMIDGLGQHKATIPAREYFRWHQSHPGCWSDKQFINEFMRDNPALKTKSLDTKVFKGASVE